MDEVCFEINNSTTSRLNATIVKPALYVLQLDVFLFSARIVEILKALGALVICRYFFWVTIRYPKIWECTVPCARLHYIIPRGGS